MDWEPREKGSGEAQVLAMAVIPHADQEIYNYEEEASKPGFGMPGWVQLWEFEGERLENGSFRPARRKPRRKQVLTLDRGRARRVKWNPRGEQLAILCGNGEIVITEPEEYQDGLGK